MVFVGSLAALPSLLALRVCELLGLVMHLLQLSSGHVATLPGSAAFAFSNVASLERSHMQYLVKQCKVGLLHLQHYLDLG